ncbi:putative SOS response-associated peptidase YedK [Pedobacter sp. UYP30]|uniref:SOS response-associated peptidase n=1 Tax=Pedobacter sp. UYP30 TaxID=1756400 RepID=UPI00339AC2CA
MCYYVSQQVSASKLAVDFDALYTDHLDDSEGFHLAGGFSHPKLSMVLKQDGRRVIDRMQWGLIPNWKKPYTDMLKMSNNTLNAKSETIFDLASFKNSIMKFRAILPVNGFFEYKHEDGDKLPFFIHPKEQSYFNLACIFSNYKDPATDQWLQTFSIVTGAANELMTDIHNTKKRQPVMIDTDQIDNWLNVDASKEEITHLMEPCDDSRMAAFRVDRNLIKIGNSPEALIPI